VIEPIYLLLLALTLAAALLAAWRPEAVGRRGLLIAIVLLMFVFLVTGPSPAIRSPGLTRSSTSHASG
jgi:hypothetical protein